MYSIHTVSLQNIYTNLLLPCLLKIILKPCVSKIRNRTLPWCTLSNVDDIHNRFIRKTKHSYIVLYPRRPVELIWLNYCIWLQHYNNSTHAQSLQITSTQWKIVTLSRELVYTDNIASLKEFFPTHENRSHICWV